MSNSRWVGSGLDKILSYKSSTACLEYDSEKSSTNPAVPQSSSASNKFPAIEAVK